MRDNGSLTKTWWYPGWLYSLLCEGRPGGIQGGCFPFRLKEDRLWLGVRIREGDGTLDSNILRYCSGIGQPFLHSTHGRSSDLRKCRGYSAEYLSPEQQERFTFVKTKVFGNKAVDVPNLEKNGISSIAETLRTMQWMDIATFIEVSYPDLVKAFYVCLRSEADGSLVSSVKGIQIKVDHKLLHMLFGVKTSGHSGVHTVNDQAKGLGIIGPCFRLRDGKIDINQMTAFNRLLHFIICQIMVPRSATFSTCTRADSDMMFWVI
ncbi:hypothetical protein Taro_048462 [Colocasia esculenta]|uniref:Uncharacterized protein n=1 Tax=Colocasia esculenta TaxID=4460 RepID=A0A843X7H4_COLES|nr:hypothetical protein [Colocasia esculenta]